MLCLLSGKLSDFFAAAQDVLLRSSELWEVMERIHRKGVTDRINEVSNAGTFNTEVNLGYRAEVRFGATMFPIRPLDSEAL